MPPYRAEQGSPEWHALHVGRITASTAAGALNLDPDCSARKAWREAMGTEPRNVENPVLARGLANEPRAVARYEVETGNLTQLTGLWTHPRKSWLAATPDRLVGPTGLLEVKYLIRLPNQIVTKHLIQCLVQLACTEREWVDYFVLVPEYDYDEHTGELLRMRETHFLHRVYPKGINGLIHRLEQFYARYVVTKIEPPRKKRAKRKAKP